MSWVRSFAKSSGSKSRTTWLILAGVLAVGIATGALTFHLTDSMRVDCPEPELFPLLTGTYARAHFYENAAFSLPRKRARDVTLELNLETNKVIVRWEEEGRRVEEHWRVTERRFALPVGAPPLDVE